MRCSRSCPGTSMTLMQSGCDIADSSSSALSARRPTLLTRAAAAAMESAQSAPDAGVWRTRRSLTNLQGRCQALRAMVPQLRHQSGLTRRLRGTAAVGSARLARGGASPTRPQLEMLRSKSRSRCRPRLRRVVGSAGGAQKRRRRCHCVPLLEPGSACVGVAMPHCWPCSGASAPSLMAGG